MSDRNDAAEVLVSFTLAWVCTIAYYAELIPGSRFVKVPFGCGDIYSLRTPEEEKTENDGFDIVDARHRKLYSWLATRARKELNDDQEKSVVLWFDEDDDSGPDDGSPAFAYVVDFVRCDEFDQNEDMIRKRASNILKSIQVCCLNDEISKEAGVDIEVWKGCDRHRYIEELRKEREVIEHGSLRVGYFEFRCWMIR